MLLDAENGRFRVGDGPDVPTCGLRPGDEADERRWMMGPLDAW
ncbi:hypothetical protein ASZ90_002211 [hydrocarbon metagenome]|uniref:Uncharacterized protein n=1 Tax=hydrocarbon metagenome TaxID=938273 RepID=A0A0W8G4G0_9ZZZZ